MQSKKMKLEITDNQYQVIKELVFLIDEYKPVPLVDIAKGLGITYRSLRIFLNNIKEGKYEINKKF